ncbi:MAG: energy transducer TonB [Tannerellaceae bacterium]|nr:energy transducer TonB [Tannerellaceae bacterium]
MRIYNYFFYSCLALFCIFCSCASQTHIHKSVTVSKNSPQFPGGEEAWRKFMEDHLTYPEQMLKEEESGRVAVCCHIGKDGLVKEIYSSARKKLFKEEVRRVLYTMPAFIHTTEGEPEDAFF